MQAIIDACRAGRIRAEPAVVVSNNRDSGALQRAAREGIAALHLGTTTHPDPEALDSAICAVLRDHGVDLVVLAGYMKKLGPRVLSAYAGRVVNIHPGLLPRHGGPGMYGARVHEAVIAAGDRETGITVHLVDAEYDTGPILAQRRVTVEPGDSAETLAARILPLEHELYVDTIARIVSGDLVLPALNQ